MSNKQIELRTLLEDENVFEGESCIYNMTITRSNSSLKNNEVFGFVVEVDSTTNTTIFKDIKKVLLNTGLEGTFYLHDLYVIKPGAIATSTMNIEAKINSENSSEKISTDENKTSSVNGNTFIA